MLQSTIKVKRKNQPKNKQTKQKKDKKTKKKSNEVLLPALIQALVCFRCQPAQKKIVNWKPI